MGVNRPIVPTGVFPEVDPTDRRHTGVEELLSEIPAGGNYKSFEEARQYAQPELERIIKEGYATRLGKWRKVLGKFGKVAVSKLACIIKVKKEGSVKARLVIDLRRSGVNHCAVVRERVVLPRLKEALGDAVHLLHHAGPGHEVEAMVADFKDAFHTLPVHPSEKPMGVAKAYDDEYIGFNTVVFGGVSSPLVWGRAAAYLLRGGQSLFKFSELLAECYVDDPLVLAAGNKRERNHLFAIFLLWLVAFGPPISWAKVARGKRVDWCGSTLQFLDRYTVKAVINETFVREFTEEVEDAMSKPLVGLGTLRRIAGRAAWAMGLVPTLRSFLDALWTVAAELQQKSRDDEPHKKLRKKGVRGEPAVETSRVLVSLAWLRAFLQRAVGVGELGRTVDTRIWMQGPTLRITCDASPWGLGAVLEVAGSPAAYLEDPLTAMDEDKLNIQIGSCKGQAVLEMLALLVAMRAWLPMWASARCEVTVRSDSQAALGAALKLASPSPVINKIARETGLDVASSKYGVDFFKHVPGKCNEWADALSRLHQPGGKAVLPAALLGCERTPAPQRNKEWWESDVPVSLVPGSRVCLAAAPDA